MCVCLCVWQRAAKQDGCARLLLAETLRGTDRVVDAEERRGMKEWFHRCWRLPISSYLLSCHRCVWPALHSEVQHLRRGVWRRDGRCRGGDETSCRDHCAEGLRGAGRGFELTVFILCSSAWTSWSRAPDCWRTLSVYLHGSAGLLPEWHLGRLLSWIITGQTIWNNIT